MPQRHSELIRVIIICTYCRTLKNIWGQQADTETMDRPKVILFYHYQLSRTYAVRHKHNLCRLIRQISTVIANAATRSSSSVDSSLCSMVPCGWLWHHSLHFDTNNTPRYSIYTNNDMQHSRRTLLSAIFISSFCSHEHCKHIKTYFQTILWQWFRTDR